MICFSMTYLQQAFDNSLDQDALDTWTQEDDDLLIQDLVQNGGSLPSETKAGVTSNGHMKRVRFLHKIRRIPLSAYSERYQRGKWTISQWLKLHEWADGNMREEGINGEVHVRWGTYQPDQHGNHSVTQAQKRFRMDEQSKVSSAMIKDFLQKEGMHPDAPIPLCGGNGYFRWSNETDATMRRLWEEIRPGRYDKNKEIATLVSKYHNVSVSAKKIEDRHAVLKRGNRWPSELDDTEVFDNQPYVAATAHFVDVKGDNGVVEKKSHFNFALGDGDPLQLCFVGCRDEGNSILERDVHALRSVISLKEENDDYGKPVVMVDGVDVVGKEYSAVLGLISKGKNRGFVRLRFSKIPVGLLAQ